MNIKHFIPPIVGILYQKLKPSYAQKYKIGHYEIDIPPNFALPHYQQTYRLYDRFLPILAKHVSGDKIIIDVGANIGDTAIAMVQNCTNPIICIEPSDLFFQYLERNVAHLSDAESRRIRSIKQLVGTGMIYGNLNHSTGGTARIKVHNDIDSATYATLDNIVNEALDVIVLKVDTDGFDYDVLKSADRLLTDSEPILFWENALEEDFQYNGFNELYSFLGKKGYNHIWIFDNYGNIITEEIGFETLKNINSYLYSMKKQSSSQTFNYVDVLATTLKYSISAQNAIQEYKQVWINQ